MSFYDISTAQELVNMAFELVNLKSQNQSLSGADTAKGMRLLNMLLDQIAANNMGTSFFNELTPTLVANQSTYTVYDNVAADIQTNPIMEIGNCVILYSGLQWPVKIKTAADYYDMNILPTVIARPTMVFLDNSNTQSKLIFYPTPDQAYNTILRVKQTYTSLQTGSTLSEIGAQLRMYLLFELASLIAAQYPTAIWSPQNEQKRIDAKKDAFSGSAKVRRYKQTYGMQTNTNADLGPYAGVNITP